jgi:hypothetical protein
MPFSFLYTLGLIFEGVVLGLCLFVALLKQTGVLFFLLSAIFYPLSFFLGMGVTFVIGNFRFLKKTVDVVRDKSTLADLENTSKKIGEKIGFWPFILVLCFNSFWLFWVFGFWTQRWFNTFLALILGGIIYGVCLHHVIKIKIMGKIMDDLFGGDNF